MPYTAHPTFSLNKDGLAFFFFFFLTGTPWGGTCAVKPFLEHFVPGPRADSSTMFTKLRL